MQIDADRVALLRLLAWCEAMGADSAVADVPLDWSSAKSTTLAAWQPNFSGDPESPVRDHAAVLPRSQPQDTRARPRQEGGAANARGAGSAPFAPASRPASREPDLDVRQGARLARDLGQLRTMIEAFTGCGLKATAKSTCVFRGAERAPLMIIGEAPGRDEDIAGRPFVGRAGQLLDRMLSAIGMDERDVHITNVVYWRPPGNRTPTPQEAESCRPFLERQIELVGPRVLLLLGGAAAKQLLGLNDGILKIRGKWRHIELDGRRIPVMASLHPAYLLRSSASKRLAWRDLLAVRAALEDGTFEPIS